MKTGKGKTHIIFQLLETFKVSTLILCHNIKVAHETKEKLIGFTDIKEGQISLLTSKSSDKEIKEVTITTHKNFKENFEIFKSRFQQIIYDECDINISRPDRSNRGHCMTNCIIRSDCNLIWGLTGTPYRDGLGQEPLLKLFGNIIQMPDQDNNGYNMLPEITQLLYPSKLYEWNTWGELVKVMADNAERQEEQIKQILKNHRRYSLVLFDSRYECDLFHAKLQEHTEGVTIIKMYGGMSKRDTESNEVLLRESNSYIIVGTTDMMGRGVDIPSIDMIFFYCALKFKGTIVQAVGRCLRVAEGKLAPVIIDWCDIPLLNKQMRERVKSYKLEYGKNVLINKVKLNENHI